MKLHVNPADGEPFERSFDKDSLVVGRSTTSDLALADPFLSRFHARLFRQDEKILVEDLGSRNGTFVNGRAIQSATVVEPGDVIKVSGSIISLHRPGEAASVREHSSITDLGATIFRPASEMLREGDTETRPDEVEGEDALRRYAERLKLLNEIHEVLGRSLSTDELLDQILERAFRVLRPEQGVIFLRDPGGEFRRAASRSAPGIKDVLPLSRSLIDEVCEKGMAALVLDAETDERFAAAESIIMSGVRSLIATPLIDAGESLGMMVVSSKAAVRQFSEEDMEILVSMASVAALKLRNAALAEEAAERRRYEEQLSIARRIQQEMLPDRLPQVAGYSIYARNIPFVGVSGDYYQAVPRRDDQECVLMIADVSGKGIGASLITASLEALSVAPIEDGLPSDEICRSLSRRLHSRSPPEKYATALLTILERDSGHLQYTSAGHNPGLLLRRDGEVELLHASGPPIGLVPGAEYEARELELEIGDTLLLYTDGITEAENRSEEEYGLERLREVARTHREEPLQAIAEAIDEDLDTFAEGVPFADDRTLLMLRRTG